MEMNSIRKSFDLMLLTLLISFLVAEYKSTRAANQILPGNTSAGQQCTNVTRSMSVLVNTMAVLSCCFHPIKNYLMLTWEIHLRDNTPCILAYRSDRNETKETNCSGEGITREIRPEWNNTLRIDSVTTDNDGYYKCVVVAPDGNFQSIYHLSVLVPPTVTLSEMGNGTVVCKAAVGKPAAQIFWVPEGDCFTVNETHDNRTVTVKSMCIRNHFNESNVTCFISHLTGNKNLSTEYGAQGSQDTNTGIYKYVIPSVVFLLVILAIATFVICKKSNGCRTCKSPKPEATPGIREDEMEPYASYTEKSNPLYDTRAEVKIPTASQIEDFGLEFQAGLTS